MGKKEMVKKKDVEEKRWGRKEMGSKGDGKERRWGRGILYLAIKIWSINTQIPLKVLQVHNKVQK